VNALTTSPPVVEATLKPAAGGAWGRDTLRALTRRLGQLQPDAAREQRHLAVVEREFTVSGRLDDGTPITLGVGGGVVLVRIGVPTEQPPAKPKPHRT
jgi:hypothetical protein